jgi:hypothetical protein
MFHPKHVELFAGNEILYKKSVILLEHLKKIVREIVTRQRTVPTLQVFNELKSRHLPDVSNMFSKFFSLTTNVNFSYICFLLKMGQAVLFKITVKCPQSFQVTVCNLINDASGHILGATNS